MRTKTYLIVVLLLFSSTIYSQIIPDGYKFLGNVKVDKTIYHSGLMVSDDSKYLVVDVGVKRDDIRVFEIESWNEVRSFDFRRVFVSLGGFFDKYDSNIFYLEKAGRWMYKCNIETGEISTSRRKKIKGAPIRIDEVSSISTFGNVKMIMQPQKYIINIENRAVKVYVWHELLKKP